jgi:hypothetical protein
MKLATKLHRIQSAGWPASGKHILAHFDDESIVVYQAYRPETALYALQHGHFGGPTYSFNRMSWIKPNFRTCLRSRRGSRWSAIGMRGCFGCAAWAHAHASSRGVQSPDFAPTLRAVALAGGLRRCGAC